MVKALCLSAPLGPASSDALTKATLRRSNLIDPWLAAYAQPRILLASSRREDARKQ